MLTLVLPLLCLNWKLYVVPSFTFLFHFLFVSSHTFLSEFTFLALLLYVLIHLLELSKVSLSVQPPLTVFGKVNFAFQAFFHFDVSLNTVLHDVSVLVTGVVASESSL